MPVEPTTATPRFYGVTPPATVLFLAVASLGVGIALLVTGHAVVGGALLGVAVFLGFVFVGLARRLPDTTAARLSAGAMAAVRAQTSFAVETLTAQSTARMELFRLRRELSQLLSLRAEAARLLGEAVYADDEAARAPAHQRMAELDGLITAKEGEMEQTAAQANERVHRAKLQVQPTEIEPPEPMPEPYPPPSEPPVPEPVPEPLPEPSEPTGPVIVPEPGPAPSPPPRGE